MIYLLWPDQKEKERQEESRKENMERRGQGAGMAPRKPGPSPKETNPLEFLYISNIQISSYGNQFTIVQYL